MTNEEIEQQVIAILSAIESDLSGEVEWEISTWYPDAFAHTKELVCSLLSQVYEEAAQRLERRADYVESHMPNHNMAVQELREMSTSSRALKDSLSPEVVSA